MRGLLTRITLMIGAAFVVASCDSATRVAAPEANPAVAPQMSANDGISILEGQLHGAPVVVSRWIDSKGGVLSMNGEASRGNPASHILIVPPNAVSVPTLFTMRLASTRWIIVELTAEQQGDRNRMVTVHTFAKPLTLALSYASAKGRNPGNLSIAYLPDGGGQPEVVPSMTASSAKLVIGSLPHFSRYAICAD